MVILLAGFSFASSLPASAIFNWIVDVLGLGFVSLTMILILVSIFSGMKLLETRGEASSDAVDGFRRKWLLSGLQACNGIATIALTFTLLGISLGIGSLSHGGLTPDTINDVISELTQHFSMAFMTSVIGLPVSAVLRTILILINATVMSGDRPAHHATPLVVGE
jgi:hypothetical protein